jgi:hypothetical protein
VVQCAGVDVAAAPRSTVERITRTIASERVGRGAALGTASAAEFTSVAETASIDVLSALPVRNDAGEVVRWIGAFADVHGHAGDGG